MSSDTSPDTDSEQSLEERFLAGMADEEPDEFDEELSELTRNRQRGSVLRPVLMIIVILLVVSVLHDWRDDLSYFFTSSEPVELGNVATFSVRMNDDPDWEPPLEHNSYVSLRGMPTRISQGERYEIFRLIGAEIYVQRDRDPDKADQTGLPPRNMGPGVPVDEHRREYNGQGRLLAFASIPDRVEGLKQFYGERYNIRYCEDFTPRQIEDLERQRLETYRSNWQRRYREATEEERQQRDLTPQPTEADEQANLARHPICVNAYLIHDEQSPGDHWWYVLLSALLSAFVAYNFYKLYAWFRDWLRP